MAAAPFACRSRSRSGALMKLLGNVDGGTLSRLWRSVKMGIARGFVGRDAIALVGVGLVGVLVVVRAFQIPIVYDESYSIQIAHISRNPFIANNHPLNTIWLIIAWLLPFGDAEIGYRLLSVASFFVFGLGMIRLLRMIQNNILWGAAILSLLLNPLLIEFWGLARGYALATAAVTWMLVAVVRVQPHQELTRIRVMSPVAIWGLIAFYSNFSTLFLVVAAWLVVSGALSQFHQPRRMLGNLWSSIGIPALLLVPGVLWLGGLSIAGRLYYSGSEGLVQDTLQSLVMDSTVGLRLDDDWLSNLTLAIAFFVALALVMALLPKDPGVSSAARKTASVVVITSALWLAAHYVAGAGFPL